MSSVSPILASSELIAPSQQRLPILFDAADRQIGPLSSAIAVVTYNASQPPHIPRPQPPQSLSLLKQLLSIGTIADEWADLYPSVHWGGPDPEDCASRRLLRQEERYRVRRACYRIWLYDLAFHNALFPRFSRLHPPVIRSRAALLRAWTDRELGELLDMQSVFRTVLEKQVCPSNGTIIRRHKDRYGELSNPIISLMHIPAPGGMKHWRHLCNDSIGLVDTWEGWGDDVSHYYVIEDMMKLHPGHLMQLYHFVTGKTDNLAAMVDDGFIMTRSLGGHKATVEAFVADLGEWFDNNGETRSETIKFVVNERGGNIGHMDDIVVD
ncbi:MAG: hypothetical protein LQ350_001551 [Teloschistes chrysophthalmus]|nr:MAG: hypothetical protein LQ350_001551 [Niorma chrysophthalma]